MRFVGRALLVAIAGVASMVGVACSLLTSLEGLADGVPADGGPGQVSDGEAGAADTSTPVDGGDAASSWCTTHQGDASFCEDFDTRGLTTQWEGIVERGGGTTKVDTAGAVSPPASLLADMPPVAAGDTSACVIRQVPVPRVELTAEADLRVDKTSAGSSLLQLMKLLQLSPTAPKEEDAWEVGIAVASNTRKLVLFQYNYYSNGYTELFTYPTPVALGEWTRVKLHLRLRNVLDGVIDLDIDGTRVLTAFAVQPVFPKAPFQFFVGAIFTQTPHSGWTARADNVLLDVR